FQPLPVSEIVDRALDFAARQFPAAKVAVDRRYAANLPLSQLDAQLCEQVFINLIVNAYQAMEGAEGALRISIAPETSGDASGAGVLVEDSGPGVAPELREQIFNPFFTSKKDGVGLGLSIVAKIVDDHRGWIKLESGARGGARFHVFLPEAQDQKGN
ncbi:MAG: ATP-binding protein, partial [Candidatus Binataceae bacterium]